MAGKAKQAIGKLFAAADIEIGGGRPWDVQVHDENFYGRVLSGGSLALGEAYMDSWWDTESLDQFFEHIFNASLEDQFQRSPAMLLLRLKSRIINCQSRSRAHIIGERHYNVGNDLFTRMLDSHMAYSCGYWRDAKNLEQAQTAKLDLICRKLGLMPGMRLLDIGCGWGSLVKYAAEHYGVKALGITVSSKQAKLGKERCTGLPVEIQLEDYRSVHGQFDRIASVGMVEHVGKKNYHRFMQVANQNLCPGGLFLLQTIGSFKSLRTTDPWINKYIFPNSMLPSISQLSQAAEPQWIIEDLHSFGPDYDLTLMAWYENFVRAWPELIGHYDQRFFRMWSYYLMLSAASFRSHNNQLWQIVLTKRPRAQPYLATR
jgi:cyclopropane-fatty-acyl-phospholipid synthase